MKQRRKKVISMLFTMAITIIISANNVFATGIGTAEVQTATDNIKRVITSIAMPLRWCTYFCKYSCSSNKNDC